MGKQVSQINIGVTANNNPARKSLKEVSADAQKTGKDLEKIDTGVGTGKAIKDFDQLDKKINDSIRSLYKLRAEAAKGGDTSAIAKSLQAQQDAIQSRLGGGASKSAGVSPADLAKRQKNTTDVLKKIGGVDLAPEGLMNNPLARGAVAAFAVVSLASAVGQGIKSQYEQTRDTGVSMGVGGTLAAMAEGLPVIGGFVSSVKESAMYLTGFAQSLDMAERAAEAQKMLIAAYQESTRRIKDIRLDSAVSSLLNSLALRAMTAGGVAGRGRTIDDEFSGSVATEQAAMQKELQALKQQRDKLNADFREKTKPLQNTAVNGTNWFGMDYRGEASSQLGVLGAAQAAANKRLDDEEKALRDRFSQRVGDARQKRDLASGLNDKTIVDMKGIQDLDEQIATTIRTGAVDDIDALKKKFTELGGMKLDSEAIDRFNQSLDHLRRSQKKLEGQKALKAITEDLKDFGLTADEVLKKKLMLGGASGNEADNLLWQKRSSDVMVSTKQTLSDGRFAYLTDAQRKLQEYAESAGFTQQGYLTLKLALDTQDAAAKWKAFRNEVQTLDVQIAAERAGTDARARKFAEIDNAVDENGRPKYTKAQADELKKKYEELILRQGANALNDKGDPKGQLEYQIGQLQDQYRAGFLDDKGLRQGIKDARAAYTSQMLPTSNPELTNWGDAAMQRALLVGTGAASDASNPELAEARKTNEILQDIKNGLAPSGLTDF